MPATPSSRLGLHGPSGGDPADIPADVVRLRDQLDARVAVYDQGVQSGLPPAGVPGRMFYATDFDNLWLDTGSAWVILGTKPGAIEFTARVESSRLGWLACDGAAVSRTTYAVLFAAISTTFGAGDGRTTFHLPDLRGRTPIGTGTGPGLTARALAAKVGAETHRLTTGEMPAHGHGITDPGHSHVNTTGIEPGANIAAGTGYAEAAGGDSTASARTGITVQSTGGDGAHNNVQPSIAFHAWIKV